MDEQYPRVDRRAVAAVPPQHRQLRPEPGSTKHRANSFGAALARHPPFLCAVSLPLQRALIHPQVEKFFESLSGLFLGRAEGHAHNSARSGRLWRLHHNSRLDALLAKHQTQLRRCKLGAVPSPWEQMAVHVGSHED